MFDNSEIVYEPAWELSLPEKIFFKRFSNSQNYIITKQKGFFKGDKEGLFHITKGQILLPKFDSITDAKGEAVIAVKKSKRYLYNADAILLAGDDCTDFKVISDEVFTKCINGVWEFYRLNDGSRAFPKSSAKEPVIGEDTMVLYEGGGAVITDFFGNPVINETYEEAYPFSGGFARVKIKNQKGISYITREGKVIYSGAGDMSRDFCNGFAVILDDRRNHGAINANGVEIITPKYKFLKDFDGVIFVCSNDGCFKSKHEFSGKNYGAITGQGKMVIPLSKVYIGSNGTDEIEFGHFYSWTVNSGSSQTTYRIVVKGVADINGKIIFDEKYVQIGELSDGLRAFIKIEGDTMILGYMDDNGNTVITIAEVRVNSILKEDLSKLLGSFVGGKAEVFVEQRTFPKNIWGGKGNFLNLTEPYYIDKLGQKTTPPDYISEIYKLIFSQNLPFAHLLSKKMKGVGSFSPGKVVSSYINIGEFSGMLEITVGEHSFAIYDENRKLLCARCNDDNLSFNLFGSETNYARLQNLSPGLWLGVKGDKMLVKSSGFESPNVFRDGLARFRVPHPSGKKKMYCWGFCDVNGNEVIKPQYKEVSKFDGNRAHAVKFDGTEVIIVRRIININQ